jgi:methionyl-tRNA formyltransferase
MVERFDAGPILLQRAFPLGPRETTSSLEMRCTSISAELAVDLMRDFSALWDGRTPQAAGTFCRTPRRVDRTLNLMGSVDQIDRVLRAFSPGGVFVPIEGRTWVVFDAACWQERHSDVPGTVVALAPTGRLLAAADGYLLLRSALPEKLARLRFAAAKVKRFIR